MKQIDKTYRECFILTDHKLRRLIQIAKQCIGKTTENFSEAYTITLADEKELITDNLEQVLMQDNAKKNPIIRIECKFSVKIEDNSNEIQITYNSAKDYFEETIYIIVRSLELAWAKESISAIEEQVERTIPSEIAYSINKRLEIIIIFLLVSLSIGIGIFYPKKSPEFFPSIQSETAKVLLKIGHDAKTDSEKISFLHQYAITTLEKPNTQKNETSTTNKENIFLITPLLIWLILIIVILLKFYPRNIFSWGDVGEAYNKKVETRKSLWWGAIFAFIVSILSGIFLLGVNL